MRTDPPPRGSGTGNTWLYDHVNDPAPCGCTLSNGFCSKHSAMMGEIHEVWRHGPDEAAEVIWSMQDGYGEPGLMPVQGYDWSGIRDSSLETIDAIYEAIHA